MGVSLRPGILIGAAMLMYGEAFVFVRHGRPLYITPGTVLNCSTMLFISETELMRRPFTGIRIYLAAVPSRLPP